MKVCAKCKESKCFDDFCKSKSRKDGYNPYCKQCTKDWRELNREVLKIKKAEYYRKDIEASRLKLRERYAANPQKFMEEQRSYYSSIEGRRRKILSKTKERAKEVGLDFNLTIEDIVIPTHCPFLGTELTHSLGKGQLKTNSSIDRIDNTKGYVKGNVQIISRQANSMKTDATPEQLITFSKAVLRIYERSFDDTPKGFHTVECVWNWNI